MRHPYTAHWSLGRSVALTACILGCLAGGKAVQAADVTVPGSTDFPESMSATSDGSMYFGSIINGRIFRATPGATVASEFIKGGANDLSSSFGVLADEKSNTLYVCSNDFAWAGVKVPTGQKPTAIKMFDLKTGAAKDSVAMPASTLLGQPAFCNDMVVASDGTLYATDSTAGHIVRLKPGSHELEVWAHDARWDVKSFQLDGIAMLADGSLYANIFDGDGLYRIAVNKDGSAGAITKLETSRPLFHSDGLRAYEGDKLLMVEGETKGNLDEITLSGDKAEIKTIKGGFEGPVSLGQVGDKVYVFDIPLKYLFDPKAKTMKPPPFTAYEVMLPK